MTKQRKPYSTILLQAKKNVPDFARSYAKFLERVTVDQNSKSMIVNYSRSIAAIALHFNRPPHKVSVDEMNSYLYRMTPQGELKKHSPDFRILTPKIKDRVQ